MNKPYLAIFLCVLGLLLISACSTSHVATPESTSQLGPRPFYLVGEMDLGALKSKLESCANGPFYPSTFSIAHRGAPLQFPEHTQQSYTAAARMGAGIIECDVTFTKDKQLVCRHDQCDLHTTTDILLRPELATRCYKPFVAATPDGDASAVCCTSDIFLKEFKSLCGKMDAFDPRAKTALEYQGGTTDFRTDLYATCATVLTHQESIKLLQSLGTGFTPELKSPRVPMPFKGEYTQQNFIDQTIGEYTAAGISADQVWIQSFDQKDIKTIIASYPEFAKQAVYLDARPDDPEFVVTKENFEQLYEQGFRVVAPPIAVLLDLDATGKIIPSQYAVLAKQAGLKIIAWSLERSGRLLQDMKEGSAGDYYYASVRDAVSGDKNVYPILDVLAKDVGITGIFSDWPATATYYANCMLAD